MSFLTKLAGFFEPSFWLRRKLAKLRDRWKGQFYEGPEPPPRLFEEVQLFKLCHPDPTPEQWEHFVVTFALNCYRDGFIRGHQWLERGWEGPLMDPDRIAELTAHDWSLATQGGPRYDKLLTTGYNPEDPLAGSTIEQRRAFMEQLALVHGSPYQARIDLTPYEEEPRE